MLFSLVSLAVFAGIASVVAQDDFSIDIVETIECTPLAGATGSLVIKSLSGSSISLSSDGVPLGIVNNDLVEVPSSHQTFSFQNCTSTFMEETPSPESGIYYGHLVLASDSNPCIISYPGKTAEQNITTDKCSISDDSGQLLQFWIITLDVNDPTKPAALQFVGKSARVTGDHSYYTTDFSGQPGSRTVLINHVDSLTRPTLFQLNLVPNSQ